MHHAGATEGVPIVTPSHSDSTVTSKYGRRLCRDLCLRSYGVASLTLLALRFGCGSPLFGIQKSVGAGKLPVLRDQNAAFSPAREHVCGSLS